MKDWVNIIETDMNYTQIHKLSNQKISQILLLVLPGDFAPFDTQTNDYSFNPILTGGWINQRRNEYV